MNSKNTLMTVVTLMKNLCTTRFLIQTTSQMTLVTNLFLIMGVIGFVIGNDFLAYLRSKIDETNSNFTEQPHSHSALPKAFDWKNKNYEVLSQLFNTLALSESQSEMILLGVSIISNFNVFYTLLNNGLCRFPNLTRQCPCQSPFLK